MFEKKIGMILFQNWVIFYESVPKSVSFVCNCESNKVTVLCFGFLLTVREGFRVRVKFRVRAEFRVRVGLRVWEGFRVRVGFRVRAL